jgi:hypothetical protein
VKKLILIILISFSSQLFSQDYKPLLDDYNEWQLQYCFSGDCSTDIYYTNGDTIVDGINFKVLDGYHYISRGFLLREDVAEKKVYLKLYFPNGDIRDYLLYDFSLEVGDSIDMKNPATPFTQDAGYYKVDEIALLPLADGNSYRHFYLSPTISNTISTNRAIWVEGVGSLSLINAPSGVPDVNEAGKVACLFKNGNSFYSDLEIIDACEASFILDTPEFTATKTNIQIIKTPSLNEFSVININSFKKIEVFNLNGKKINSYDINNQSSIDLNLSNYKAAMYLLILKSHTNQRQVLKVIVE